MWRDVALARRITGDKAAAHYSVRQRARGLGLPFEGPSGVALPRTPRTKTTRPDKTLSEEQTRGGGPAKNVLGHPAQIQMPRHYCQAKLPKRVCRPVIRRAEAEDASSGVSAGEAAAGGGRLGSWLDAAAFSRPGAG